MRPARGRVHARAWLACAICGAGLSTFARLFTPSNMASVIKLARASAGARTSRRAGVAVWAVAGEAAVFMACVFRVG